MKRAFDFTVALAGLVMTSPVMLVAAGLVKLDSEGPAIYRANRVGRDGRVFQMYKLRTMQVNADRAGAAVTSARDPRVTRVGRVLRRLKIDELPQLINVVRGDMSLVGPRPEAPEFVQRYTPDQRRVLSIRPGITGPAALAYLEEEQMLAQGDVESIYVSSVMPAKLEIDLEYVRHSSFRGDLKVLAETVWRVFARRR